MRLRPPSRRAAGFALLGMGALLIAAAGAFYAYTAVLSRGLGDLAVTGPEVTLPTPTPVAAGRAAYTLYPGSVTPYRAWADPRGTLDLGHEPLLEGFAPVSALGQPSLHGEAGRADRIIIPAIGVDARVEELGIRDLGDSRAYQTPRHTVGHIPGTPNPGSHGNGWYFGHLESPVQGEGNVFSRLPQAAGLLRAGEDVFVVAQSGAAQYLYQATETDLVHEDDLSLYQAGDARLTLVTCQPRGRYDHRLLVTAKLVGYREAPPEA